MASPKEGVRSNVTSVSDPIFSPTHEAHTELLCQRCEKTDVFVAAFTWSGERHLQWHCRGCSFVWVTRERRVTERRALLIPRSDNRRGLERRTLPLRDDKSRGPG